MAEPSRDENRQPRPPAQGARTLEEPEVDELDDFDSDSDEENAAASDRLLEEDAPIVRLEAFTNLTATESFLIRGVGDTDFTEGSEERRQLASPQMFNYLLSAALKNPHAEAVLGDLSSKSIGPFEADPLLDAIELYRRTHPESSNALKTAAIQCSQHNSKLPLNNFIARAATEDPKFESQVREILGSHLHSGKHEEQGAAVGILLAMSKQWKAGDFQAALRFMQPDQVRDFRNALTNAPAEVQKEALRLALADKPDLLSNPALTQAQNPDGLMRLGRAPKFAEGETSDMQARIRLIAGEDAQGQPLWNLHKQYGVEQSHWQNQRTQMDNALFLPKKNDPFKLLTSPAEQGELAQAKKLFSEAFPKHSDFEKAGHKWDRNIDTRYLAATLTSPLSPGSGKPMSPEQIFERWGVDTGRFSTKVAAAKEKYGADTLLALDRRVQMFNALSEPLRQQIAGEDNASPIKIELLAGLVLDGGLGDKNNSYAFLMDKPPFEEKVRLETQNTAALKYSRGSLLSEAIKAREDNLQLLSQYTTNGVSALDLVVHGADKLYEASIASSFPKFIADGEAFTSGVEAFDLKQGQLLKGFRHSEKQVNEHAGVVKVASEKELQLEFARKVYSYEQIAQSGASQEQKDYLALMMLDSYGLKTIKERAPQIWNDLQQGGLQRLADNKLIASSQFPEITGNREEQLATAMKITSSLKENSDGYLDAGIRRNQALAVFDSAPALSRSQETVMAFGKDFATFSKLFEASNKGTKYDDIVKDLKREAGKLQELMTSAKPEDIAELKDLQKKLTDAMESATDPVTRQALEARATSVKGVLDILDPTSKQHTDLLKLLTDAQTRDFSPDDLANWLRNNGPAIAVAAAAVAITVATMGTGAPIAMVLVSSAVALGATQLTSEVLYQINHRIGDTGLGSWNDRSYVGAWGAKHEGAFQKLVSSPDWKGTNEAAQELVTSYINEVSLPMTKEYATNVVMGLVSLGALRLGQAGLKGLDAQWVKGLVANPRSLELINTANRAGFNSTSKTAMSSWLKSIAKETAEESMEEMGEEGVQVIAEKALKQFQMDSPNSSVFLAVSMGLAQGVASRRPGSRGHADVEAENRMKIHSSMRDSVMETLKATGHRVETLPDGSLSASTYSSPNDRVTIRVTDEEVSSNGRKRPGGRPGLLDENFGRRFASGDPNDALGPDNRLRQTTLRRQIDNNFPEDVLQAAGELVTGGLKRQELLERMLRMGSADCEKFGVFDLIKNNRDLDVLRRGIDAAEIKSRTHQSINLELDSALATLPPVREKIDNLHLLEARADHAAKQELAWKSLGPDAEAQLKHWHDKRAEFDRSADALTKELAPDMEHRANALQAAFNKALAQHNLPAIAIDVVRNGAIEGNARYNAATGRIELSPSILLSANSNEVKSAIHREYEKLLTDRTKAAVATDTALAAEQSAELAAATSARRSARDASLRELAQVAENLENNQRLLLNEGGIDLLLGRLRAPDANFEKILGVAPPPELKALVTKFEQSHKPDGTIDRKKWTEASANEVSKLLFPSMYKAAIKAQSDLQIARAERAPTPGEIAFDKAKLDDSFIEAIAASEFSVDPMTQMDRRTELAMDYSWAIPDRASLAAIYDFSQPGGVVEVGAGKGLWAGMLRQMGVEVAAYDINATNKDNPYHRGDNISHVEQGGIEKAADHPDKTLLLSWPMPDEPMGADALKKYTEAGGKKLVFIGERTTPGSGFYNTGDKQFHTMLDSEWVLKEVVDMRHMPDGFNLSTSRLYQYERRTTGEKGNGEPGTAGGDTSAGDNASNILDRAAASDNLPAAHRATYENAIRDGVLKPEELAKIFSGVNQINREVVVHNLLAEGKLTPAGASKLASMNNLQLNVLAESNRNTLDKYAALINDLHIPKEDISSLLSSPKVDRIACENLLFSADMTPEISATILKLPKEAVVDLNKFLQQYPSQKLPILSNKGPGQIAFLAHLLTRPDQLAHTSNAATIANTVKNSDITSDINKRTAADRELGLLTEAIRDLSSEKAAKLLELTANGSISLSEVARFQDAANKGLIGDVGFGVSEILLESEPKRRALAGLIDSELSASRREKLGLSGLSRVLENGNRISNVVERGLTTHDTLHSLLTGSTSDAIVAEIVMNQSLSNKGLSRQSLEGLMAASKEGSISTQGFESLRQSLKEGTMTEEALKGILSQPSEIKTKLSQQFEQLWTLRRTLHDTHLDRPSAERTAAFILSDNTKFIDKFVANLASSPGDATTYSNTANRISKFDVPALSALEPGLASDVPHKELRKPIGNAPKDVQEFAAAIASRDFNEAIRLSMVEKAFLSNKFTDIRIDFSELSNPGKIAEVIAKMDKIGEASGYQDSGEIGGTVADLPRPTVILPNGKIVDLADPTIHMLNTDATAQDQNFIEMLEADPAVRLLRGRVAMIAFEERMIHSKQGLGGASSGLVNGEFHGSREYANMDRYFQDHMPKQLPETLREIDVAARLIESGMSLTDVRQLLGTRHLHRERQYFYDWFARTYPERVDSINVGTP